MCFTRVGKTLSAAPLKVRTCTGEDRGSCEQPLTSLPSVRWAPLAPRSASTPRDEVSSTERALVSQPAGWEMGANVLKAHLN